MLICEAIARAIERGKLPEVAHGTRSILKNPKNTIANGRKPTVNVQEKSSVDGKRTILKRLGYGPRLILKKLPRCDANGVKQTKTNVAL